MIRNVLYLVGSMLLFFIGMVTYGILLNKIEPSLAEEMEAKSMTEVTKPIIKIELTNYKLYLMSDTVLVKSYSVVFGDISGKRKTSATDNITPTGVYRICSIDTTSTYHKLLKLNYPNQNDAAEALREGIISQSQFISITNDLENNHCPDAATPLGADIGIQGIGTYDIIFRNLPFVFNWTNGSIAMSNNSIDELYSVVQIGTPVIIRK